MVNGRLRAAVRFDEVCELVAVYNLGTKGQVTVGLGGSGAMFSIREWLPPVTSEQMVGSWVNYALLGDRANLKAGITYEIGVRVLGSSTTLDVDGVQVATTTLPAAVNQARQIGIFCVSSSDISISRFSADIERPKAFIVMQFSSPYNEVYSHVIKDACVDFNIDAVRGDETNPNVYFEVVMLWR